MNSDMDALLTYRNLLAAEDHLDELSSRATSRAERDEIDDMLSAVINIRDMAMPAEANADWHCTVKHLSTAYEGARERWKATRSDNDYNVKHATYELLIRALENLWQRKVNKCERCNHGEGQDARDDGGDTAGSAGLGLTREPLQTADTDREFSIPRVQEAGSSREPSIDSDSGSSPQEIGMPPELDGDSDGEKRFPRIPF